SIWKQESASRVHRAHPSEGRVDDAIGEPSDLHIIFSGAMRYAEFLMLRVFHPRAKTHETHPRIGLAQVGGGGIETFFTPRIGARGGVGVLDDSVGRKMKIRGTERPKRIQMTKKLDR